MLEVLKKPTTDKLNQITDDEIEIHNRKTPNRKENFQISNHDIPWKK
jgi:hypothetical protein